jgi:hypothetical protein
MIHAAILNAAPNAAKGIRWGIYVFTSLFIESILRNYKGNIRVTNESTEQQTSCQQL